ncbi:saccharopine dehydrogenase [Pyrrhoderma noxium]|uniref:Saccharopine dehydrogenase n=1 Tax=Pyrrhoderma noxium TaxID=2282107 RepID=A0A286UTP5_9AGAM|nr:saccharopine dehydrogenase [Pyrrhoderma noxium]
MEVSRSVPSWLVHTFPPFVTSRIPSLKKNVGFSAPLTVHNTAIVQRTRGLFGLAGNKRSTGDGDDDEYIKPAYAPDFFYTESFTASNRISAFFLSVGLAVGLAALLYVPPLRWIVRRVVMQPGDGPKDEELERGRLHAENISISSPLPNSDKLVLVRSTMDGKGDPGYALTAVMVSECALGSFHPGKSSPLLRGEVGC